MPWEPGDATRHTKKAKSEKAKRQWSEVANSMLSRGRSEAQAVRGANSVIKNRGRKRKQARSGGR